MSKTFPMKTTCRIAILILVLFISIFGMKRLHIQADLTAVLPKEVAQIQAVESFNKYFQDDRHIVVLMQAKDDKVYTEDVADLAGFIGDALPNAQVDGGLDSEDNYDAYIGALAEIWALSKPELVDAFVAQLQDHNYQRDSLTQIIENVRRSLQSEYAIKQSYDPFGFINHPGLNSLVDNDFSFVSKDGKSRFLFIKFLSEDGSSNYLNDKDLVEQIRKVLNDWNSDYDDLFTFGLTGGPVFNAEVGTGVQKDLLGTVSITLSLIALLFLILQRSFLQLLALIILVGVTFALTLGIAGLIMPSISVLSVGFAAILLGLIIDYAVVILREAKSFDQDRASIRKGMRSSVIWAAITTSLVFSVLILSSFPGVRQLGALILIGLGSGAFVMLYGMPWFIELFPSKHVLTHTGKAHKGFKILLLPAILILVGGATFILRGSPSFDFSLQKLQPTTGEASEVQSSLLENFESWSDLRVAIFTHAPDSTTLEAKILRAQSSASNLIDKGLLSSTQLPVGLIPYPDAYERNLTKLRTILPQWQELETIATESGFTSEGLKYDRAIAQAMSDLPPTYEKFRARSHLNGITKSLVTTDGEMLYFRGKVTLQTPLTPETLAQMHELNSGGIIMTGWPTLTAALEPVVKRDFRTIFLPAVAIIFLALIFVFRNWKEALLVLLILVTSLIVMNSYMTLTKTPWNFLNVIAFPLIVGIGIDYSIHLIFTLRRHRQNPTSIWQGVGLAISFCGLSSFIGFASLNFATNDILKSLGTICSLGVLMTMVLTLLIIPPVWRTWCGKE